MVHIHTDGDEIDETNKKAKEKRKRVNRGEGGREEEEEKVRKKRRRREEAKCVFVVGRTTGNHRSYLSNSHSSHHFLHPFHTFNSAQFVIMSRSSNRGDFFQTSFVILSAF